MQSQSEIYKSKFKEKTSNSQVRQEQRQQQSQVREQYRQQQQQPLQSTTGVSTKSTAAEGSEAVVAGVGKNQPLPQRRATVKVIKCKKPLCHFKFYLDICDHQLTKRIEEQIRTLGGTLEFFLTSSVTHFITDKAILPPVGGNNNSNNNNNNSLSSRPGTPQTPGTPTTPQTPYNFETQDGKSNACGGNSTPTVSARKANTRQTRANAILNRVRRTSTTTNTINVNAVKVGVNEPQNSPTPLNVKDVVKQSSIVATQSPYIVWQTEYALHFFKKVQHELKDYLGVNSRHDQHKLLSKGRNTADPIDLKGGGYIKIEAIKHNYRPYYQLFRKSSGTEWPKIELSREDGAFRLSPKKKITPNVEVREKEKDKANEERNMTRKSRSRSSQHQRPLHAAVQSLKKGAGGGATDSGNTVKSSPRNSQAGGVAGANATGCRQVKESSDKQCGVCEICKIEYDTLTIHLKTKDHEYFAKNSQNFIALDSLIHTSADVNKFLNEDKKVVLEEMEVENIEVIGDVNAPDPLEGSEPLMIMPLLEVTDDTRRGGFHQTPSPTLREKSKRSTKGKHSSEKFQNIRPTKSPKATSTAVKSQTSPLKQQMALTTATSSMLELQRIESCAAANVSATKSVSLQSVTPAATTRRKQTSVAAISPPIRAMLPPSSLYKVVGTPETVGTTVRKTRGDMPCDGDQAVTASPSLIVKFKKVRSTELNRLNGEAESFMFPKQRTSSELPTDIDRQTTSDNAHASFSSTSLDSTSDGPMEIELAITTENNDKSAVGSKELGKRAIANAKRRKSQASTTTKQRFPTAPIQPELQLKNKLGTRKSVSTKPAVMPTVGSNVTETAKSAISAAAAKANATAAALAAITLPEATRKSSRTATAIVTAATTSSRLLRAAVEAAKHNYRQMVAANELVGNGRKKSNASETTTKSLMAATATKTSQNVTVVKMEDRMGDVENVKKEDESESEADNTSSYTDDEENCTDICKGFEDGYFVEDLDDDDDDDDDDIDNDDENDEDYVHYKSRRHKSISFDNSSDIWQSGCSGPTSRRQRAMKREEQKSKCDVSLVETKDYDITKATREVGRGGKRKKCIEEPSKTKVPNISASGKNNKNSTAELVSRTPSPAKKKSIASCFDYKTSARLNQMRYSFERIPATDLWYRVFTRQDNCAERFFEYYGSTNYRKLPYELGPIPYARTLDSTLCCKLCESQRNVELPTTEESKIFSNAGNVCKVKSEPLEDSEACATKSRDSSSCNSNDIVNANNICHIGSANNMQTESSATQYKHKHKKLQILQRYRQEQQELQKRQTEQVSAVQENNSNQSQCDTKATNTSGLERARDRQRAGSTHSTTSSTSCASSTATTKTNKNRYLNKHLNKAASAFLNLELPPRKSPREHASTLALVSCIIKQRQDSQSKPNSEIDEPSTTPTPVLVTEAATVTTPGSELALAITSAIKTKAQNITTASVYTDSACNAKPTPSVSDLPVLRSPRHTRSAAATPVEELRFTTEISENVKRMRRGQNKYDHSPPIALNQSRKSTRGGRQILKSPLGRPSRAYNGVQKFLHSTGRTTNRMSQTPNSLVAAAATTGKRRRRGYAARRHNCYSGLLGQGSALPSIRKTGSKKGVLEFEVDSAALKALDGATKHTNIRQLEWQIDKYLQYHGSEYDLERDLTLDNCEGGVAMPLATISTSSKKNNITPASVTASTSKTLRVNSSINADVKRNTSATISCATFESNTPPPTDCFSSDFDLYDLFTNATGGSPSDEEQTINVGGKRRSTGLCLYNSLSMQNYFRKRKSLKSNRTGWPKVQKKKTSARQQQKLAQKIRFLRDIGELAGNGIKEEAADLTVSKRGDEAEENDMSLICRGMQRRRRNGVITPPQSASDVNQIMQNDVGEDEEEAGADDDTELDAGESIPEEEEDEDGDELEDDGETMMDSIDEEGVQTEPDADAAAEADEEDIEDAELYTEAVGTAGEDEDDSNFVSLRKRIRRCTNASPLEDKLAPANSLITISCSTNNNSGATSTPTTQMLRGNSRRTPQLLNGSLGSCISPSEKAGDNSDIFTVSSDGLDTDLDMSNSQHKCDDEHLHQHNQHHNHHHHHHHHHHHPHHQDQCVSHQTPKRKFDLSKYAPNNTTASSCAAEAATAAVKSLAISQFLKKEVRVTCRRLRAPFRRYRYRR
nr:protein chiffon [Bactrocera oleae]XP_036222245.1 protein chiffon [Bactrocera oleae]XP_036222246.1 protein chiffon [Bactrocera oleae]XP_036222247.1 protein chiffon [Bactrocera oleae]